jgi:competence protein ComEA
MGRDRNIIFAFIFVGLTIVAGIVMLLSTRPTPVQIVVNPPQPTVTPLPTETPGPLMVYVTGEVMNPQTTVSLSAGSRVQDAVEAAGGATDNADLSLVNMAAILRDGDQVNVPALSEDSEATSADAPLPTASGGDIININTATLEELDTLPGIGPSLAEEIIIFRETNGAFANLDDLDLVPGIGPSILEDIRDLIRFE